MAESKISVKLEAKGADKFASDLQKAESALKKFADAAKGLSGTGTTINTNGLSKVGNGLGQLGQKLGSTAKAGESFASKLSGAFNRIATGALMRIGSLITDLGVRMARFAVDAVGKGIKAIATFEGKLNEFRVVAGSDIAPGAFKGFEKLFLSFANRGVDGIEAVSAATELLRGGLSATVIQQSALRDTLNLSSAGLIDQARAAEIVVNAFNAYAKQGVTTTQIVDQISRVANKSSTGIDDLALGLANATNSVASFNDTVALVGFARSRFGSTAATGTGVRNFFENFIPKTKKAIEAQKKLGLYSSRTGSVFFDQAGDFIGAAKASDILQKSVKGLTDEQKQLFFNAAFSAKGEKVALALAEGAFRDFEGAVAGASDTSSQANAMNKGLGASWERLKAKATNVALGLNNQVAPALSNLIDTGLLPGVDALGRLTQSFFAQDGAGGKFLASLGPLSQGLGSIFADLGSGMSIGDIIGKRLGGLSLSGIGSSLAKSAGGLIGGLIGQLGQIDIGGILKNLFASIGQINFNDLFGGIAQGIASISPSLAGAVTQIGGVLNQLISIASSVAQRFIAVFQSIGPGLMISLGQVIGGIASVVSGILTALSGLRQGITQIFQGNFSAGFATIGQTLLSAWEGVRAGLANIFWGIIGLVGELAAGIVQAITGVDVSGFADNFAAAVMVIPDALKGVGQTVEAFFSGLGAAFSKLYTGDFAGAADAVAAAFDGIPASLDKVNADIEAKLAALKPTPPPPIDIPAPNTTAFTAGIQQVQQQASGTGTAVITPINIPAPNTTAFTTGIQQVQQQASTLGTTAATPIVIPPPDTSGFATAVAAAQSSVSQIRGAFAALTLSGEGARAGATFAGGLNSQTGLARAAGAALVNAAKAGASGAAGGFSSVGAQIAAGVASGIRASMGSVIAAAVAMVTRAKAAAEAAAGVNSPAKEWMPLGYNMGLGAGVGFEKSVKRVGSTIGKSVEAINTYASSRISQPAIMPRQSNRTTNNTTTNSTTRNMPVTIVTRASARESLAELALYAAMGQL